VAHPSVVVDALAAAKTGGTRALVRGNTTRNPNGVSCAAVGIDEKEILGSYSAPWTSKKQGPILC